MKRVRFLLLVILICTAKAAGVSAQGWSGPGDPPTSIPEYGWVVASIRNVDAAETLASRYRAHDEIEVTVVSAEVGSSRRFRVVLGRYPNVKSALGSKGMLPPTAPDDTWLVELPPPDTVKIARLSFVPPADSAVSKTDTLSNTGAANVPLETVEPSKGRPSKLDDSHSANSTSSQDQTPSRFDEIRRNHIRMEVGYQSRFDSNIDHDRSNLNSFGMIPALLIRYRSSPVKPAFDFRYLVARHNYTGTDRWDRFSHLFKASLGEDRDGAFRTETTGEISLLGTSEDRDLSNEYQARQEAEYRFTHDYRLRMYGTVRWKHYEQPNRNHFKPNVGLEYEQKLGNGGDLQVGVRFEKKYIATKSSRYKRWTMSLQYNVPVSRLSELKFSVESRKKMYQFKDVNIDGEKVLRRDFRWKFGMLWIADLTSRIRFEVGYKFEHRDSNDPRRAFDAHLIETGISYRL